MELTSRQRLLNTIEGKKTDRCPVSLYELDGFYDSWIHDYPGYVDILEYAEGKTDKMYFWGPPSEDNVLFYGVVDNNDISHETWEEDGAVFSNMEITTPRGTLSKLSRQDPGVHTWWQIEKLCKTEDDINALLSLEYIPWEPDVSSFFDRDKELGDAGIVMGDIPDALCLTVERMGFENFLMAYTDTPGLIFKMMDFFQERILNYLKYLLEQGAVTMYRIIGPEYATPPYIAPAEFAKLVTSYDRDIVELMHEHGAYARLHSHGNIKQVLDEIISLGIDAMDPVEPPPDGDIELKDVRAEMQETVLIGNVEERILEHGNTEDVEEAVKTAVEQAGKEKFILCTTAMPLNTPLEEKIKNNIMSYIDFGLEYCRK